MISDNLIRNQINNTLQSTNIEGLGEKFEGKVRDNYRNSNGMVIVTTDRISAFDRVLGTIPFKGQILNQLAAFWFDQTKGIVDNHLIDMPDPNVMVVRECESIPVEMVVRGYITGVTKTSAWYNYSSGVRNFCGNVLPEGLKKDQKFDHPIITPTTKTEKHDRSLSREEIIKEGLVDADLFDRMAEISLKLFDAGTRIAANHGLILADTKYEFGLLDGKIVLIDEIHTPDSSRFWFMDTYQQLFDEGKEQRKLDKEYVRTWLAGKGFLGDGDIPAIPDEVKIEAAKRYMQAYELITGRVFEAVPGNPAGRIISNLKTKGVLM
ncbi:MAG: phosphoribosylaminoimidazolesuccinocarboxamide synthase [Candidatus Aenigmarchaeota archaeon]|nr:phosphoribosylaminoimidazolesuccinocarboxamide synthase [Candidatus Aenigmarchaeota archaeon]